MDAELGESNPILSLLCQPKSASSLRDGSVSLVFHVPHELAADAFKVHDLQDHPVRLDITEVKK